MSKTTFDSSTFHIYSKMKHGLTWGEVKTRSKKKEKNIDPNNPNYKKEIKE